MYFTPDNLGDPRAVDPVDAQQEEEQFEAFDPTGISIDDITGGGDRVPPGHWKAELASAPTGKLSKAKGRPMIEVTFTIIEGEHDGKEVKIWYSLGLRKDKKTGRVSGRGVAAMRKAAVAVGNAIPQDLHMSRDPRFAAEGYLDEGYYAKLLGKALYVPGGLELVGIEEVVMEDDYKTPKRGSDGAILKTVRWHVGGKWRPRPTPTAPGTTQPSAERPDPLAGLFFGKP